MCMYMSAVETLCGALDDLPASVSTHYGSLLDEAREEVARLRRLANELQVPPAPALAAQPARVQRLRPAEPLLRRGW